MDEASAERTIPLLEVETAGGTFGPPMRQTGGAGTGVTFVPVDFGAGDGTFGIRRIGRHLLGRVEEKTAGVPRPQVLDQGGCGMVKFDARALDAIPVHIGYGGTYDVRGQPIGWLDDRVPLDLGVGGLATGPVPMGTNLHPGREVAAGDDAAVSALAEQEGTVSDNDAARADADTPSVTLAAPPAGGPESTLELVGRPLPAVRVPGEDERRHWVTILASDVWVVRRGLSASPSSSSQNGPMSDEGPEVPQSDGEDEDASERDYARERRDDAGPAVPEVLGIDPKIFENLLPFRELQRTIAHIDFGAVRAVQMAAASTWTTALPDLEVFQESLRSQLASTIDFSAITRLASQNLQLGLAQSFAEQHQDLAKGILSSLNMPALQVAQKMITEQHFPALAVSQEFLAEAFTAHYADLFKTLATVDVGHLLEQLERWLPFNLRGVENLEEVARIALEEGLPVGWVPRASLVISLANAASPEERLQVLLAHREDVLDDCLAAVSAIPHNWARECEAVVRAMRADLEGPAQSHAANIVDSIVLWVLGKKGRDIAKSRAQEEFDDLGLRVAEEALVLRPLYLAMTTWWPETKTPPPGHFARHATAHAVGYPGLFAESHVLVAVMLAVSLTVQYWDDPSAAAGLIEDKAGDGDEGDAEVNE